MKAEILSTGDEVCAGVTVDTNAPFIAQKLEDAGIVVLRHGCVGDDRENIVDMLREMGKRADIAVITGGLGPTTDDVTAEAAACADGSSLEINAAAMSAIEHFFKKNGRYFITKKKNRNSHDLIKELVHHNNDYLLI